MSDNNDSGGGCLLWFIDIIWDIVTNRRIWKYNKQSRGLEEYNSISTEILFPTESYLENIIISGGDYNERLNLCERIINNCYIQNRAMIILHLSNGGLENIVARNNYGNVVNKHNKYFDAFTSFDLQEICQIVFDTCKAKYDIKPSGRYILQIVYDLLTCKSIRPYFSNFANCPYHKLSERINDRLNNGHLTQDSANNLHSLLMMGQAECAKIDSFFYDMKTQMSHIAVDNTNDSGGVSILSAIKNGQILCLDLNSSSNIMLIELIVNSLIIAMNRGYEFSLLLDDISISNNEILKNMLCQKANHNYIISSKDLYSLLGGKDDVFNTITGETDKTVLLSHGSHLSCEKWSKYIGEYDKIDVTQNRNAGWSQSSKWGYSTNQGQSMSDKREYRIKPDQLNRLIRGEAVIYDNQTGSLIQATVI